MVNVRLQLDIVIPVVILVLILVLILLPLLAQLPGSLRGFRVLDVRLLLDIGLLLLSGARLLLGVGVQVRVDVGGDLGCRLHSSRLLLGIVGRWGGRRPQGRTRPHMGRRVSRRGR